MQGHNINWKLEGGQKGSVGDVEAEMDFRKCDHSNGNFCKDNMTKVRRF